MNFYLKKNKNLLVIFALSIILILNKTSVFAATTLPPIGNIETPTNNQTISGIQLIKGWLLDGNGVSKVEVLIDGVLNGQAVYGDSRPDVINAYPSYNNSNAGYHYNLDTTKLSNGTHTLVVRETGGTGVQTSLSITINIISPIGNIETPTSNQTISGIQLIKGWLLDVNGVSKVEVLIDGALDGQAVYGDSRPDVLNAYPSYNNSNAGYHYNLDTTQLSNGTHTLIVREIGTEGTQTNLQIQITVSNSTLSPKGSIDCPINKQTISGTQLVGGWFLDGNGVSKVEVLIDGALNGQAVYGGARPDVMNVYPQYNNSNSGYNYNLDTTKLSNGAHTLVVKETGGTGVQNNIQIQITVNNTTLPPIGNIETPINSQTINGLQLIKGWYLDGNGVSKLEILIDGVLMGQAVYGDSRPDVINAYPSYNNSNAGYHYNLDTTKLSNGTHTLVVRETGGTGIQANMQIQITVSNSSLSPKGSIDCPINKQTISRTQLVGGWFLDGNGVSKIEILIDGALNGQAVYGGARPDVMNAYPQYNNSNSGYNYNLDTTKLSNGSHTLVVRETGGTGVQTSLSTTINTLAPKGSIDCPINGQQLSGTQLVGGWFLDGNGVSKIEILIDGALNGQAVYGGARSDVMNAYPQYNNSNSGYNYNLDTTKLSNGSHTLVVRETGGTGTQTGLSEIIKVSN